MSKRLKKLTIKNTINTGRKKSEKGKIEGQELQFFLSTSDNRLQRVKSGARLFSIIHKKEENQKPIELIEHVIHKQSTQNKKLSPEEKKDIDMCLTEVLNGNVDMAKYLGHTKFDPCQEIIKEKNIEEFFKQKYNILMMYIEDEQKKRKPKGPKGPKKARKTYSQEIFDLSAVPDLKNMTTSKSKFSGFTSAQDKVQAIEEEVSRELDQEWEEKYKEKIEQEQVEENIQKFCQKLLTQKKKVQSFVDPRSSKIRKNFKVINEHIENLKKIDPNTNFLNKKPQNKRRDKFAKTNIEVLADILTSSNQVALPLGKKNSLHDPKPKRMLTRAASMGDSRELFIPNENDLIEEYELEALQNRVLSQNIKQGLKKASPSKRFHKSNSQNNIKIFQDFKSFMRPSTSQMKRDKKKLVNDTGERIGEPKFLSEYQNLAEKDVKTYRDLKTVKHQMPLEINYKYKVDDFYKQKKDLPPTAATKRREIINKHRAAKTSQGKRIKNIREISAALTSQRKADWEQLRSSSAKRMVESIPSKRPTTQGSNFPSNFAIGNTLGLFSNAPRRKLGDIPGIDIEESSSEFMSSNATKDPTEMVLHMKGPIYSTAKRNDESPDLAQKSWKNKAYMVDTKTNQFFRYAKHNYESVYTKNNF
ncbi:unnamed protein product [Moneuplotes crassus]|uniref:Uncharacterized protein n=1 Tax=Euplotes crassus TaxID=5936 RepID=A0AAD1U2M5_EUPCR|nr:unnamed protein product [Moneuplotes crassus]